MNLTSKNHEDNIIHLLKSNVKDALVEKFLQGSERPCDKNDFLNTIKKNEKLTSEIKLLIESFVTEIFFNEDNKEIVSSYYSNFDNELLVLILILCGQNHSFQFWNTAEIVENCNIILFQVLKLFDCKDLCKLISKNYKINLAKNILLTLSKNLTKSEWKHFPADIVCYQWILHMIKQPELSQHLQLILPPALLLIDDFVTENRITGAKCLNHIIQNVTISELQLCGHGEIIYSALLPLLRVREACLIQCILPPLVSVTSKLEFDLGTKSPAKWTKFDSILEIYLENMELEQIIDLRNCYISNLSSLFRAAEHNVIRWAKRLLKIFNEYVKIAGKYEDKQTIQHCVEVIEIFIELSKEVAFLYEKELLLTLLMALLTTTICKNVNQNNHEDIIIQNIRKLTKSFSKPEKEQVKNNLKKNLPCSEIFLKFNQKVSNIL